MKRCIVCGSIGDDDTTVCKVCGNPFIDLTDQSDKSVAMSEMEKRLEQVWSKVQEDEQLAGGDKDAVPVSQDAAGPDDLPDEPEVTVLPDLPEAGSAESGAASAGAEGAEISGERTDTEAAPAPRSALDENRPLSKAESILSAEESVEPVQQAPQGQIRTEAENEPSAEESGKALRQEVQSQTETGAGSGQMAGDAVSPMPGDLQGQPPMKTENSRPAESFQAAEENAESAGQQMRSEGQSVTARAEQAVPERQTSRPRRRSGPQIYGQDSMTEYRGTQGVIRRDVHGGGAAAGHTGYGSETRTQQMRTADRQPAAAGAADRGREGVRQSQDGRADRAMNRESSAQGGSAYRQDAREADRRTGQNANVPPQRLNARQRGDMQPYAQVPQEDRQQVKGAFAVRKTLEISRGRLTSPLLLFVALFHTVYFVGAIAAVFMGELDYSLFGRLLGSLSLPSQLASYVSMFQAAMAQLDNGAIVIDLLLRVPDLLFFLGLWLLCITARTSKERMSGAGFVFVRIALILNMIAACLLLFVVLVLSVTLVIASWSARSGRLPIAAAVMAAAIVAAMAIVMYYFCYLATISAVSKNARAGESYGKASAYVALVHMVLAFTAVVNVLSGILNGWIPVAVGGAGKFLWMLLFGVWIFSYRNALSEYNE